MLRNRAKRKYGTVAQEIQFSEFYRSSNDLRWKSQAIRPNKPPTRMDKKSHGNDTSAFSDEGRPVIAVRLFHAI